jgi:hypothetical protein
LCDKSNRNTHHSGGKNWNKKIIHSCFQPAKKYTFIKKITGGMASGAGSIVGTATAVGAAAWGLSKSPVGGSKNITNFASGFTGDNYTLSLL